MADKAIVGLNNYEGGYQAPTNKPYDYTSGGYSAKVFTATGGYTGTQTLYTVPTAKRFILTRIFAATNYAAGKSSTFKVESSQYGASVTLWTGNSDGTNQMYELQAQYPIEYVADSVFKLYTGGGNPDQVYTFTFEGYELSI